MAIVLIGCQTSPDRQPVRRSQPLLGTYVVVTAYGADQAKTLAAITAAFDEIRRIDSLMSLHRTDSELSRVNATAATKAVSISPDLFKVISYALAIAEKTDGAFDPTIAPLTRLWGFLWKDHRFPSRAELDEVLPLVNYRLVQMNSEELSVRFKTNGVTLDLNAIAKGYTVDQAIETLRSLGVTNVMVRAGGDLRVIGAPPGETAWPVQLEDPEKTGRRMVIRLRDAAVSTSGSYENFFVHEGHRYSHILNPRTGLPIEQVASCSVIMPTCMGSDAWATALCVLGPDRALAEFGARLPILFGTWHSEEAVKWRESAAFRAFR